MQISQYLRSLEFLEINNLGFSTALEFQGIPNYVISRTQRVELLAIFLELEAKTASCGQGMTQFKSELKTANDGQHPSTFYSGLIRGVGSKESCLLFSKSHLPPSWIISERPLEASEPFSFGSAVPRVSAVLLKFVLINDRRSQFAMIFSFVLHFKC